MVSVLAHVADLAVHATPWGALAGGILSGGAVAMAGRVQSRIAVPPAPRHAGEWSPGAAWVLRLAIMGAVLVGLRGGTSQITNPMPPLAVGLVPPFAVISAATGCAWWQRANPLRTTPGGDLAGRPTIATVVLWLVGAPLLIAPSLWEPRLLATILRAYVVVAIVADLLSDGRTTSVAEPFTRFIALVHARSLGGERDALLLGSFAALATVGAGRATGALPAASGLSDEVTALLVAAGIVGVLHAGWRASATPAAVIRPVAAAAVLAAWMAGNRITTSVQLLVVHASDPLATGLDHLGTSGWPIDADVAPPVVTGAIQCLILIAGARGSARLVASSSARSAMVLAVVVVAYLVLPR